MNARASSAEGPFGGDAWLISFAPTEDIGLRTGATVVTAETGAIGGADAQLVKVAESTERIDRTEQTVRRECRGSTMGLLPWRFAPNEHHGGALGGDGFYHGF
jgi:hypothetical protein